MKVVYKERSSLPILGAENIIDTISLHTSLEESLRELGRLEWPKLYAVISRNKSPEDEWGMKVNIYIKKTGKLIYATCLTDNNEWDKHVKHFSR